MTIALSRESVVTIWPELAQMVREQWQRYDPFPDWPLEIEWGTYQHLEYMGLARVYTARRNGVLEAFAGFIVLNSPRRAGSKQATQDTLHSRSPFITRRLIFYSEQCLRDEGVDLIYHSSPAGGGLSRLLTRSGYRHVIDVHAKRLKE